MSTKRDRRTPKNWKLGPLQPVIGWYCSRAQEDPAGNGTCQAGGHWQPLAALRSPQHCEEPFWGRRFGGDGTQSPGLSGSSPHCGARSGRATTDQVTTTPPSARATWEAPVFAPALPLVLRPLGGKVGDPVALTSRAWLTFGFGRWSKISCSRVPISTTPPPILSPVASCLYFVLHNVRRIRERAQRKTCVPLLSGGSTALHRSRPSASCARWTLDAGAGLPTRCGSSPPAPAPTSSSGQRATTGAFPHARHLNPTEYPEPISIARAVAHPPRYHRHGQDHRQDRGPAARCRVLLARVLPAKDGNGLLQPATQTAENGTGPAAALRQRHLGSRRFHGDKVARAG